MNKLKNLIYLLGLSIVVVLTGCSDPDDEVTSIDYDRLFTPTDFKARVINKTQILMTWNASPKADNYTVEVYANADLNFEGTPVIVVDNIEGSPYTVTGLDGETDYSIRLQAVGANTSASKWAEASVTTDSEQIFQSVVDDEITANSAILRWPAGEVATQIVLDPGNIIHNITSAEIAAGAVTIEGLLSETKYTAKLINGTKTRGTIEFTTKIDLGDAIAINPGDDIVAILDAAEEGDSFVVFPGEYSLGDYALTKSITISGYKASDKPVIYGRFTCKTSVNSFSLKTVIMDGKAEDEAQKTNVFEVLSGCNLNSLSITDSELRNYQRTLIYNNSSGTVLGDVLISNNIISGFGNTGGDGIDIRNGSLASLTVEKCTFNGGFRAFMRVQVTSNIKFTDCTFYKISAIDDSNNSGLFRSSSGGTFEVSNCLFVETGVENPTSVQAGNWCRNSGNMKATTSYSNNVYYNCHNLWVGLYTNPAQCSATEENPQFEDAEKGDFTVKNVLVNVGDPRWLP